MAAVASANVSQRPVRTSISDAISSPTRWGSSGVPTAPAATSSKRLTGPSVWRSRIATLLHRDREVAARIVSRASDLLVRRQFGRHPRRESIRVAMRFQLQSDSAARLAAAPEDDVRRPAERGWPRAWRPGRRRPRSRTRRARDARPGTRPRALRRSRRGPNGARRAAASQSGASAATIPALGKIDGVTLTSAGAHRCARWRCSRGPVKRTGRPAATASRSARPGPKPTTTARASTLGRVEAAPHRFVAQLPDVDDRRPRHRRGTLRAAPRCRDPDSAPPRAAGHVGPPRRALRAPGRAAPAGAHPRRLPAGRLAPGQYPPGRRPPRARGGCAPSRQERRRRRRGSSAPKPPAPRSRGWRTRALTRAP